MKCWLKPSCVPGRRTRKNKGLEAPSTHKTRLSLLFVRVLERACYQCEYTGPGGVRCTARAGLEIDHRDPYAKGRAASEENLRALCRAHNLFSAAREFGEGFMRGKIERRTENHFSRSKERRRGLLERV